MSNLLIGFQSVKSKPSLKRSIMGKVLGSEFFHCEMIFQGNIPERFSAWSDFGTGFRSLTAESVGDLNKWIFFDLGTPYYQAALQFANSQDGKGYDLKSAVNQSLKRTVADQYNSWYCSEVVYAALRFAGMPLLEMPASSVLPPTLYQLIESFNYSTIAQI